MLRIWLKAVRTSAIAPATFRPVQQAGAGLEADDGSAVTPEQILPLNRSHSHGQPKRGGYLHWNGLQTSVKLG